MVRQKRSTKTLSRHAPLPSMLIEMPLLISTLVNSAIDRFDPHPAHQCGDMTPADLAPFGSQQAAQHPRACERELQMQLAEPPHQRKVCGRHRRRFVVDAAPADAEERCLLRQRKPVGTVDHRFALGNPALPSARSKKSFSRTSSPILACSDLMSTSGTDDLAVPPRSNTSAAPSSSCSFHEVI